MINLFVKRNECCFSGLVGFSGSFILVLPNLCKSIKKSLIITMFSRAISQSARMTSRVIRSPSIKSVVKRHSHDHAGTPPPPYVQRTAPTKSVYSFLYKNLICSFLSMLN